MDIIYIVKTKYRSHSFPPKIVPEEPTIDNYFFVLTDPTLARSLINSLIVSIGSTALSVAVSALGGYALRDLISEEKYHYKYHIRSLHDTSCN